MRENLWNKLFHRKALKEYKKKREIARRIMGWSPQILQDIQNCKTLIGCLDIHKDVWSKGFQNINLSPCEWGMFRTKSIPEMTIDEVFLGGIYGLHTKNIRFWNQHSDAKLETSSFGYPADTKIYDIVLKQYKDHLKSNVKAITDEAVKFLMK